MTEEKMFYTAEEVAELLLVSKATAYRIINKLNKELEDKGFYVMSGRVPKKFFTEKFYS